MSAAHVCTGPRAAYAPAPKMTTDQGRMGATVNWKLIRVIALLAAVAAITFCSSAQTQTPHKAPPPKPAHDAAMEAMFGVLDFQQAEISPDGKRVAWVESLPGAGGAPSSNSAIYVADLSAPTTKKRITAGDGKAPHEEHDIAWSADSKQLAFLSDAPKTGQLQLFITPVSGARDGEGPRDPQGRLQTGSQRRQAAHPHKRISRRPRLVTRFENDRAAIHGKRHPRRRSARRRNAR